MVDRTVELTPDAGTIGSISSFGEDGAGELYVIDYAGEIFCIGTADSGDSAVVIRLIPGAYTA